MAVTVRKETAENTLADKWNPIPAIQNKAKLSFISAVLYMTYSGCTSAPTARSDSARLNRRAFEGGRSEEHLVNAQRIDIFPATAVTDKMAFSAQLMMKVTLIKP